MNNSINVNYLTPHNAFLVLSFLDNETLSAIIQAVSSNTQQKSSLVSMARSQLFLRNYLNKTDRSIYMHFYSQPLFLKMEQEQLFHICSHSAPVLFFLQNSFKSLFSRLQAEINDFQLKADIIESVTESLTDPELPFPKLRKQNIGMHCNSPFQFFLADKLLTINKVQEIEDIFQELNKYLQQKWNPDDINSPKQLRIIEQIFSSWFKISYQNFQDYLIPRSTSHNLVVIMIALLDVMVDLISFFIESIKDPLYAFIEFNMRYCLFRNTILSLEEKLGFLFKDYSTLFGHFLGKTKEGKMQDQSQVQDKNSQMTIWHCGLSKWYIYMQRNHESYFKSFFYLLKKLNLATLKMQNQAKIKQNQTFLQLQNRLDLNEIQLLEKDQSFDVYSPVEQLFQERKQFQNQIIKQYVQYIVDISINQYSVHWCGHSEQALHIPYQEFESLLLQSLKQYTCKVIAITKQVKDYIIAIDSTIKSIVEQLDREYLKPVTLKKIVQFIEEEIIRDIGDEKYQSLKLSKLLNQISLEFEKRDKVLTHFNELSKIKNQVNNKYNIVIQSEGFNKALKTSASTTISHNSRVECSNIPFQLKLNSNDSMIEQDFS